MAALCELEIPMRKNKQQLYEILCKHIDKCSRCKIDNKPAKDSETGGRMEPCLSFWALEAKRMAAPE
jgi:hypothetical protein